MDPSIMKFLEEDEDETMHSGADVEAFTAALNRDIEGDNTSTSSQTPTTTDTSGGALTQGTNHTPSQLFQQWQSANREGNTNTNYSNEEDVKPQIHEQQQQPSAMETQQHPPNDTSREMNHVPQDDQHNVHMNVQNTEKTPEPNLTRNPENETQIQRMHRGQAANAMNNRPSGKQVPFALLLPVIEPQLDKDRAMQLQGLYVRLRNNNINKEEFVRHMRSLVGDHMLKLAVYKLQQSQIPGKHNIQKPSPYVPPSSDANSQQQIDNNPQKSRLLEHQSDSSNIKQDREQQQQFPLQGINKQQQMHFPQSSFPNYGNPSGNFPNMNMSFKPQTHDLQMRQGPVHMGSSQPMSQNTFNDMKRMHFGSNSGHWQPTIHNKDQILSSMAYVKPEPVDQISEQQHKTTPQGNSSFSQGQIGQISGSSKDESFEMMSSRSMSKPEPMSITAQLERQNAPSVSSSHLLARKKPMESPVSSISKKQKVSGAFSDQSIEQLNDVTAVSGVNLREEEEQLFSGSKEESRVSEASRKVVQEEEERLILQKIPLQKKLAEIMAKCGVKNRSSDVERCLSLCVEERMRGLISNLIRLSKQRVDIEKPRHRRVITSDVRQQIMSMNQKAREELEKKQADAEKLQRADETDGSGIDGEDGRGKSKANKEEDDKMRTTAANVAARAAVGGDDMLSKWQLMAEQARQKREGGADVASTSQPSVDVGPKPVSNSERNSKDNSDTDKSSGPTTATPTPTPGPVRKSLRNQELGQSGSVPRTISVKDVISVLGREIQMSRSTLIYRLYEKVRSDSVSVLNDEKLKTCCIFASCI
ncbi:hypothetical protein L2E82_06375 [Cichorium intybus]|uniref:Uncharacterized protein n=1 Tax=Cichorium intybus TaxID=13427 RepID=A0ACB9H9T0_CICIN|nr:hypothetical protein L2E82_06375 [Cichorium intybus]